MSEFADHLHDVFRMFGPISVRRMFGGYGVYRDGLMFALVADDALYLKVDAHNVGEFLRRELPPFEFHRAGKTLRMSYRLAPDEVMEDHAEAALWARRSFEAAVRAKVPKRRA
jgi:DNA transformation protein